MATYRITAPDGGTYDVTAPDDATQDQVLAYAKENYGKAQKGAEDPSLLRKASGVSGAMAKGFTDSVAEAAGALPALVARGMNTAANLGAALVGDKPPEYQIDPNTYANTIKKGFGAVADVGRMLTPDALKGDYKTGTAEKVAYGAGHGAGDAASIIVPAAYVANTARAGTLASRVGEQLAAQPGLQVAAGMAGGATSEATDSPGLGLAASLAVPGAVSLARGIVSPVTNRLTPEMQRLAQQAEAEGIRLTPGQMTGSKPLQTAESVLEELPFSSGPQRAIRDEQQAAFNRAVLSRAGETADRATPDVVDAAFKRLGQNFTDLSARNTVAVDNQLLNDVGAVESQYLRRLPVNQQASVKSYIDDIRNSGQAMAGDVYQDTRSMLSKSAKGYVNSDPLTAEALRKLRIALDEAATRSISAADSELWNTTRQQYGNLKAIAKAVSSPSATSAGGDISGAQLWNAAKQGTTADQFARGSGDLNDLARIGQAFIKPQTANSGSAQRLWAQGLLTGGPLTSGATMAAMGSPVAGGMVAGSLALPRLAQMLMNSDLGRAYLTNQAAQNIGPQATKELLAAVLSGRAKESLTAPR